MKLPVGYVPGVGVKKATGYGGFGQKMLEKMGWKTGDGLGRSKQGITEAVEVKKKEDTSGVGSSAGWNWSLKHWEEAYNSAAQTVQAQNSDSSSSSSHDSSDSDASSDDEEPALGTLMHRDGTAAATPKEELALAQQLAKDPWGRFGGREGKMARIRRQEQVQAHAARNKLGLPKRGLAQQHEAEQQGWKKGESQGGGGVVDTDGGKQEINATTRRKTGAETQAGGVESGAEKQEGGAVRQGKGSKKQGLDCEEWSLEQTDVRHGAGAVEGQTEKKKRKRKQECVDEQVHMGASKKQHADVAAQQQPQVEKVKKAKRNAQHMDGDQPQQQQQQQQRDAKRMKGRRKAQEASANDPQEQERAPVSSEAVGSEQHNPSLNYPSCDGSSKPAESLKTGDPSTSAAGTPSCPAGWWGHKYFVSAGRLPGMEDDVKKGSAKRQTFNEGDQTALYMDTFDKQSKGKKGLGQSSRLKIAGGNWEGTKVTFAEEPEAEIPKAKKGLVAPSASPTTLDTVSAPANENGGGEEGELIVGAAPATENRGNLESVPDVGNHKAARSSIPWLRLAKRSLKKVPSRQLKWKALWKAVRRELEEEGTVWEATVGGLETLQEKVQGSLKFVVSGKTVALKAK